MQHRDLYPDQYRPQIEALLSEIGLESCEVLVVESVKDWAQAVGIPEDDPFRAAMVTIRSAGSAPTVVLRRHITTDIQTSVLNGMEVRGFLEEVDRLDQPELFLEHLVLHEAAHLLLRTQSEADCDDWAFQHLAGRFRAPDGAA